MAWRRKHDAGPPDAADEHAGSGESSTVDDESHTDPLLPDDSVLDELSRAFADDQPDDADVARSQRVRVRAAGQLR